MKSEHRRDLNSSELEKLTAKLGGFFEKYGKVVLLSLVIGTVVIVGGIYAFTMMGNADADATTRFEWADSSDALLGVADLNAKISPLARLNAADRLLQEGLQNYFTQQKTSLENLKRAKENYELVLDAKNLPDWASERALYGIAVSTESLPAKNMDDAVAAYKALLTRFPDTMYKDTCEERIERLQREDVQEFYTFMATADRKPTDRKLPTDMHGFKHPSINPTFSELPVRLEPTPKLLEMDLDDPATKSEPFPPTKTGKGKPSGPELNSPTFPPAPAPSKSPAKTPAKTQ